MAKWTRYGILTLLGIFLGTAVRPAMARDFYVTNTSDVLYQPTLRQAIITANEIRGSSTIYLGDVPKRPNQIPPIWTFRLTMQGQDETAARTGDLNITDTKLTIMGEGSNVVIDASELVDRVFQVSPGATLTLENLTITGGRALTAYDLLHPAENGGAILNAGTVTLKNCIIINNVSGAGAYISGNIHGSIGGSGGGICNLGKLVMNECQVANNSAGAGYDGGWGGNGGGIFNSGTCFMTNCIIANNAAGDGGAPEGNPSWTAGGGGGGGIYNNSNLVMIACAVVSNTAGNGGNGGVDSGEPIGSGGGGGDGAGIYNAGTIIFLGGTITGNQCGFGGSGGWEAATPTQDSITGGHGGDGGSGGGIFNVGPAYITNSVVTDNICGNGGSGGDVQPDNATQIVQGGNGGNGGSGGGIYNYPDEQPEPVLDLQNDTVDSNQVGNGGNAGSVTIGGTPGNTGQAGTGPDISE